MPTTLHCHLLQVTEKLSPPTPIPADNKNMAPESVGQWLQPFELSNVAVHASLLPNGKVLYWGRRENPKSTDLSTLDEHATKAFVWDPVAKTSTPTANEPRDTNGNPVNLFCSGHSFLPDGTLLIAGGHIRDGRGPNQACVYDPETNTFTPKAPMNKGRWYPSVLTLPDGRALVISGSYDEAFTVNNIPQIWPSDTGTANPAAWIEVTDPLNQFGGHGPIFPLYPRLHLSPEGRIIIVGPLAESWWLDVKDPATGADIETPVNVDGVGRQSVVGRWTDAGTSRQAMFRDYCPSVVYDTGKIMYMGGGLTVDNDPAPTNKVEFLDLHGAHGPPEWTSSPLTNMRVERRQFNATVLPDGTVLVTGGTKGSGFNDLSRPVHDSELWDPVAKKWTDMAPESVNRCYHSTALLLPDGTVLSAGGGEYGGAGPDQCLTNAQLFEPPYLHKGGGRPTIVSAPSEIAYGQDFAVTIGPSVPGGSIDTIDTISWVRLGSVTHTRNMSQSLMFLTGFRQAGASLTVPAPANANLAPPGHYMLFVLDRRGVPSVARIIRIAATPHAAATPAPAGEPPHGLLSDAVTAEAGPPAPPPPSLQPTLGEHSERIVAEQSQPPVVVGLTPICPYGLGPCWGGAYDALRRIPDIEVVNPVPNQADSVAFVYPTEGDMLPDIDVWRRELARTVNSSYEMRGIEMTLSGVVTNTNGQVTLAATPARPQSLLLAPFKQANQLKWDIEARAARPISDIEAGAYQRLHDALAHCPTGAAVDAQVTGTLQKNGPAKFSLHVRQFELLDAVAPASDL
ncbi:hypothetical protein B0H67DRAFT_594824 [Lasiosphaeris hirsuta]|uniref:Galactose oxidase-like Early set domain-containing protein n=1 Tax=Lasiosphaeris hirsuta TaxID=260670 RepID=A0AA39ZS77_9PEZI|nr:hypothetical protein B0H67DRAFT_594824 [Lasiosphaeris hirsuta]